MTPSAATNEPLSTSPHRCTREWYRPPCMPDYESARDAGIDTPGRYLERRVSADFVLGVQLGMWELGGQLDSEDRRACAGQWWRFSVRHMAAWLRFYEDDFSDEVALVRDVFEAALLRLDPWALAEARALRWIDQQRVGLARLEVA